MAFIGCAISLISSSEIRYTGELPLYLSSISKGLLVQWSLPLDEGGVGGGCRS